MPISKDQLPEAQMIAMQAEIRAAEIQVDRFLVRVRKRGDECLDRTHISELSQQAIEKTYRALGWKVVRSEDKHGSSYWTFE